MKEQREKTLKTLQNKLFVTPETREAIHRMAGERSGNRAGFRGNIRSNTKNSANAKKFSRRTRNNTHTGKTDRKVKGTY